MSMLPALIHGSGLRSRLVTKLFRLVIRRKWHMNKSTPQRVTVAIDAMTKLLSVYSGVPVSIRELSKTSVSISYLEQIFSVLRGAGLIVGSRGPGGGYSPCSTSMTVADVIRGLNPGGFLSAPSVLSALETVSIDSLIDRETGKPFEGYCTGNNVDWREGW
ncbi:hypothetical protein QF33_23055 [Salmonella enterica subsp. enterica serovar Enteritidis]|nr:hypothetical protein [Salmonella enterica subsp. enterica serovar Enteritidis]